MENIVKVRACFTGCNIKSGKTVMQFELDPEHKGALPQLAMMTGTFVTIEITSDQMVMFVDTGSGEVIDGQEEAFADDDEDEDGSYQLPPAAIEYEDVEDEAFPEDEEDEGAYQLPPAAIEYEDVEDEAA